MIYKLDVNIRNINSGGNTEIGLLLYIKSNIQVAHEIGKIESGGVTDLTINQYFQNSPDFQKLQNRIDRQTEKVRLLSVSENESKKHLFEMSKLEGLQKAVKLFKLSALKLAETFLRINIDSERLTKARALFDRGLILEADKILAEQDLLDDQEALLAKMEYLQKWKYNALPFLSNIDGKEQESE